MSFNMAIEKMRKKFDEVCYSESLSDFNKKKIKRKGYQPVANNILGSLYDPGSDFLKDEKKYNELKQELNQLKNDIYT